MSNHEPKRPYYDKALLQQHKQRIQAENDAAFVEAAKVILGAGTAVVLAPSKAAMAIVDALKKRD